MSDGDEPAGSAGDAPQVCLVNWLADQAGNVVVNERNTRHGMAWRCLGVCERESLTWFVASREIVACVRAEKLG